MRIIDYKFFVFITIQSYHSLFTSSNRLFLKIDVFIALDPRIFVKFIELYSCSSYCKFELQHLFIRAI